MNNLTTLLKQIYMLNYLIKHSLRSFKSQHSNIIITDVLGFSFGITCRLLIAFPVRNEASEDKYKRKGFQTDP